MKATELLNQQHRQIDSLFDQIEGAAGAEARRLVDDLATILVGHAMIEKETFYPACEADLGASAAIRQALEEHALALYALQKLLITDSSDERFLARVAVLRELVHHHVLEEDELIARVNLEMDEDRLEDLGERMEARYEEVQDQDVKAIVAREVQYEGQAQGQAQAPGTTRRRVAKKPARKAAAKPARPRKAPARAAKKRGAEKAGRKAPARKKAPQGRVENMGRGEQERSAKKGSRAVKGPASAESRRTSKSARKGRAQTAR